MARPLAVFEDYQTAPRRRLFSILGTPWNITPYGWIAIPAFFAPGFLITFYVLNHADTGNRVLASVIAGLMSLGVIVTHEVGHQISARLVGGPMDEVLIAAVRLITLYHDTVEPPSRVHLGRALGGPIMNLILAAVLFGGVAIAQTPPLRTILMTSAFISLGYGLGSFLPIPSVDGEVIWRELRKQRRTAPAR